jgi:hypothetical protein
MRSLWCARTARQVRLALANGTEMFCDALIWACCAGGKAGMCVRDMAGGGENGLTERPVCAKQVASLPRETTHTRTSTFLVTCRDRTEQNASSSRETWWGAVYLAKKYVRFPLFQAELVSDDDMSLPFPASSEVCTISPLALPI